MNNVKIITSHGKNFEFDFDEIPQESIIAHAMQGIKIRLDRSSASLTKDAGHSDQERQDCAIKLAKKYAAGEMPKSGGGGSRLSIEDRALKAALQSVFTFQKKETLDNALTRYTEAMAKSQKVDFAPEMLDKVTSALKSTETYKAVIKTEEDKNKTAGAMAGLAL